MRKDGNTNGTEENLFRLVPVPRHCARVLPLELVPVPGHGAQISVRAPAKARALSLNRAKDIYMHRKMFPRDYKSHTGNFIVSLLH